MNFQKYDSDRSIRWRRKSLRLPKHDYTWNAAYFVTMRAREPGPLFETPELRTILEEEWKALPKRYPGITLDEFIIMPDHVHFIVCLDGTVDNAPTLGTVVGTYKSLTIRAWLQHIQAAGLECRGRFWQRNYFEHVIRDARELEDTRQYIRNNPIRRKANEIKKQ